MVETVGIVGESGSGKSLSCMAIAQLTDHPTVVDAGLIEFDGTVLMKDGKRPDDAASRKVARQLGTRMAMVFQDPMSSMNPSLKVGYQVAEIGWLHEGMSKARREEGGSRATERRQDPPTRPGVRSSTPTSSPAVCVSAR